MLPEDEQPDEKKAKNIFNLMVDTLSIIANKLLNNDPILTELFFLDYALEDLVTIME